MNVQEFAALAVGDKVECPATSSGVGEIVEATDSGVRVVWGPRHSHETRFFYGVVGTAWFQWSRVENEQSSDPGIDSGNP